MRRGMILLCVLTVLSVSVGLWMDLSQQRTARMYLDQAAPLRALVEAERWEEAEGEQAYLYAAWEKDARRLNLAVSHHHTRAVTTAMLELTTATEHRWKKEALQALDALEDALEDVEKSDFPYWENIL